MATLEGRYDFRSAEPRLQSRWADLGINQFDPSRPGQPYTVDTPPPTVSGRIHAGHVYSYTQADVVIRYHQMKGENVFYPFGFDDNGLPTERFVEKARGIRARDVGRRAFIDACLALSAEVEAQFERFWTRLGLSVDWRLKYSTIDPRSRRVSQAAFLESYAKGHAYRQNAPTLWCPECGTAIAQADVEDKAGVRTFFTTIPFRRDDGREVFIATTRPELLPACVAVIVRPDDRRYQTLLGRNLRTPLFDQEVPVLADERAAPEKGTGAVMCCTFGDVTDVAWWHEHHLPLRLAVTRDGRLNDVAGPYADLPIKAARARILDDLATAGLIRDQQSIEHSVGVHERCGTEVEYTVASQWFIKLLPEKQRFLEAGRRITWYPEHMRARYEDWIEGLRWDWNVSRQRVYGVPFPVWYCRACDQPILADPSQLPVDPAEAHPPLDRCPACGEAAFVPETDVMDTWATSSLTPRICATLLEPLGLPPEDFDRRYRPMSLRPNAHDIIRTWDFYTIVRSLQLTGEIPWTSVLIAGHALDPKGKKISKSKLTIAEDPTAMLEQYSADAVRYWAASVRTGNDTLLSEDVFKNGQRLVTKLWNAAKLVLAQLDRSKVPIELPEALNPTDRWLLARLAATIRRATALLDEYEFAAARAEVERFFWADLCDNYLELVKFRLYGDAGASEAERDGARHTLFHALLAVLKLFAPYLPHVTEEIYLAGFAAAAGAPSIHRSSWPVSNPGWESAEVERSGQALLDVIEAVRHWKAERQLSVGAPIALLTIRCPEELQSALVSVLIDLRSVTRANQIDLLPARDGAVVVEIT
jgi:valyl-tRNA synthetase